MNDIEIAEKIANAGGRAYLVGGCVRDVFLNKEPHDKDYCITGLTEEKVHELFPEARVQGKGFPVFIINGSEYALARKERKTGEKHTDFEFDTSTDITIVDDLKRRDLTINSMAVDVLTKEIIDPYNGREDIKNKIIRMTSDAFEEDPLRVYRVARFASQLGFNVDEKTLEKMQSMKQSLNNLSVERVFVEFRKALNLNNPTIFFEVLRKCDCLDVHFPEIANLIGVEQPIKYHPEGDAYVHSLEVLDRVSKKTDDELTRFGGLVHDLGKAATPRELWPHHYNHDEEGQTLVKKFCYRLKMPLSFWRAGRVACREHMKAGNYNKLRPGSKVDLIERVERAKFLTLEGLETIANSDSRNGDKVHFAEVGHKIMDDISFTEEDRAKVKINSKEDYAKIREYIRNKRIKYLRELEIENHDH